MLRACGPQRAWGGIGWDCYRSTFFFGPRMMWREACLVWLPPEKRMDAWKSSVFVALPFLRPCQASAFPWCRKCVYFSFDKRTRSCRYCIEGYYSTVRPRAVQSVCVCVFVCAQIYSFSYTRNVGFSGACHGFALVIVTISELRRNV
jgi:hypothetical protein